MYSQLIKLFVFLVGFFLNQSLSSMNKVSQKINFNKKYLLYAGIGFVSLVIFKKSICFFKKNNSLAGFNQSNPDNKMLDEENKNDNTPKLYQGYFISYKALEDKSFEEYILKYEGEKTKAKNLARVTFKFIIDQDQNKHCFIIQKETEDNLYLFFLYRIIEDYYLRCSLAGIGSEKKSFKPFYKYFLYEFNDDIQNKNDLLLKQDLESLQKYSQQFVIKDEKDGALDLKGLPILKKLFI